MSFNFYFAGSTYESSTNEIRKLGCNQLLSQIERKPIADWCQYLRTHPECKSKLFIDSGAFTAHTKGKQVDVDEYINFINSIDDCIHIFAQVDCIPGTFGKPRTEEENRIAPQKSWENYLYMVDKVKSPDKLLPIFHQGEDFKWLKNMLEYRHPDGHSIKYIGISYAKDMPISIARSWLVKCFEIVKSSSNPNVCSHCFGSASRNTLENFPFTSSDSTTWIQVASKGSIIINGKTIYVSDQNLLSDKNVETMSDLSKSVVENKLKEYGYTLKQASEHVENRMLINIHAIKEWADNYNYRGDNNFKISLF